MIALVGILAKHTSSLVIASDLSDLVVACSKHTKQKYSKQDKQGIVSVWLVQDLRLYCIAAIY